MGFVDREMDAVADPKNRASFFEGHFWFPGRSPPAMLLRYNFRKYQDYGDRRVLARENSSLLAFANPVL